MKLASLWHVSESLWCKSVWRDLFWKMDASSLDLSWRDMTLDLNLQKVIKFRVRMKRFSEQEGNREQTTARRLCPQGAHTVTSVGESYLIIWVLIFIKTILSYKLENKYRSFPHSEKRFLSQDPQWSVMLWKWKEKCSTEYLSKNFIEPFIHNPYHEPILKVHFIVFSIFMDLCSHQYSNVQSIVVIIGKGNPVSSHSTVLLTLPEPSPLSVSVGLPVLFHVNRTT